MPRVDLCSDRTEDTLVGTCSGETGGHSVRVGVDLPAIHGANSFLEGTYKDVTRPGRCSRFPPHLPRRRIENCSRRLMRGIRHCSRQLNPKNGPQRPCALAAVGYYPQWQRHFRLSHRRRPSRRSRSSHHRRRHSRQVQRTSCAQASSSDPAQERLQGLWHHLPRMTS